MSKKRTSVPTKEELKDRLDPLAFEVTQNAATEPPFSGQFDHFFKDGDYFCTCCGEQLFKSSAKFNSGCGWPAFDKTANQNAVDEKPDFSHGMQRIEVVCANCKAHLGHVFPDGPTATGVRYCINSVCLDFKESE